MPLSCRCNEDSEWWYMEADDYEPYPRKRSTRCYSCDERIRPGDVSLAFERWRDPKNDIEERIHGDEVRLAFKYHCERCADLFLSLRELGFCPSPSESMLDLVKEYAETYGPQRAQE